MHSRRLYLWQLFKQQVTYHCQLIFWWEESTCMQATSSYRQAVCQHCFSVIHLCLTCIGTDQCNVHWRTRINFPLSSKIFKDLCCFICKDHEIKVSLLSAFYITWRCEVWKGAVDLQNLKAWIFLNTKKFHKSLVWRTHKRPQPMSEFS